MKVCDLHHDRKAVDTIHIENDHIHHDVCKECREAVIGLFSLEPGASQVVPDTGAKQNPKLGLHSNGRKS
jgi:hypothetical protein